jgi:hypothetical protein
MTFYNVISGILFLGTCQAFLQWLGRPAMFMAATLAAIMANEAVLTSELLEKSDSAVEPLPYSLGMKFIDLGTFVVLSYALLILTPTKNTFDVDVKNLWCANNPSMFLVLISVYWLATWWWNRLASQDTDAKWQGWFLWARRGLFIPFLLIAVGYWTFGVASFEQIGWRIPIVLFATVMAQMFLKLVTRKP